jgi:hypothetical protein
LASAIVVINADAFPEGVDEQNNDENYAIRDPIWNLKIKH